MNIAALPIRARSWHRRENVVAVAADLRASTSFSYTQRPQQTAALLEVAVGGLSEILAGFGADFMQAQGDGGFGLFWGDAAFERALCAAITVQTFSQRILVPGIEQALPQTPATGFKIGVACGPVLVKKVGKPRLPDFQEPVWVGRPVNYAAKCAQQTDPHRMLVTGSVWDWVEGNDYLAFSCPCGTGPTRTIWQQQQIAHLRPDDPEASGRVLTSTWCEGHGQEYCDAVMVGRSERDDVLPERSALQRELAADPVATAYRRRRRDAAARRRGLSKARAR